MELLGAHRATEKRKDEHIELFESGGPRFRNKTTLLEEVDLVPRALPGTSLDEVDLRTEFLGRSMNAPVLISSMTGGTSTAGKVNMELAEVAAELGLGIGLGSQRAMLENPARAKDYMLRHIAPDVFIGGNIGIAQVIQAETKKIVNAVDIVGADALFVHLNPAMEAVQVEGDSNFKRSLESLSRLVEELDVPVIIKEVGSGIDPVTARSVADAGVRIVDVAGAGGTSWVGVEALRGRASGEAGGLGETFWDWGIPTAACLMMLDGTGLDLIGSGGLRTGLDAAKCLALGAKLCGVAGPVMEAYLSGGRKGCAGFLRKFIEELRLAVFLTGCKSFKELVDSPRVIGPVLWAWTRQALKKEGR
ncbi:MAG: type 2 isopentenyl-diphosphate Delta-isomerase [Deltaproteobacteria bacterium]|nr:type 2 isopentenyl-diphosphate Delta-isomerase [Deltaproteobacteria bacterium]